MGEEPRDEPIDVSIKPPVDVTLRAVDPSAQGSVEGPADGLVAEDPVAKATREARESQEGQQEPDVRLGGSPDSPGGELMEEDPVAKATREARESQEGQQEAEPDDIGAVALTPHQVELQEHDSDPKHTRGNPEMAYFISEAQNAIQSVIANIESMPGEMISPYDREIRIAEIRAKGDQSAAEAMGEFNREKALRDVLVGAATQRILTQVTMGEKATGAQLVYLGRERSSDEFIPGQGQSSDKLSKHSANQTLREVLATAGVDPGVLSDEGWENAEGMANNKRRLYESSIPGFQVLETRSFDVAYEVQSGSQAGEPDYTLPKSIILGLQPIDRSAPESQPQNDVTPDSDHVIV